MSRNKRSRTQDTGASSSEPAEDPNWGEFTRLSEVRPQWQPILYQRRVSKNKDPFIHERLFEARKWEPYGVVEPFRKWGWMAALEPVNMHIYKEKKQGRVFPPAVVEWISTLVKEDGSNPPLTTRLTGKVFDQEVTLSRESFNNLAGEGHEYDTGVLIPDTDYEYPSEWALFENGPTNDRWFSMIKDLFVVEGPIERYKLKREDLRPLPRALSVIVSSNILPRKSDLLAIRNSEVPLLHALVTGKPALSLRHIMMMIIWASREYKKGATIVPYVRFLSAFLHKAEAIPGSVRSSMEKIKPTPLKVKGLYFFQQGQVCKMTDVQKDLVYEWEDGAENRDASTGNDDSSDSEGGNAASSDDRQWTRFQQEVLNRQRDQARVQEYYRQQDYEYAEQVRHHNDYLAGLPYSPVYSPVDYSRLERSDVRPPGGYRSPPYPGIPKPLFYQPPPPSDDTSGSQWDMTSMARGLNESLFSYPPPPPPQ